MRIRIPILAFLIISFFSCEQSEDPIIKDPIIEDPIAEDEKKPELTVTGFTDVIETTTDVSISIVDESTVETKVMHEGEEIASSTEKQFNLSVNPYGIPVGPADFSVISTDAKGNETTETYSIEIKHLLVTYEFAQHELLEGQQNWIFFNSTDGTELAVHKVEVGVQKVYTDELLDEEKIFFTTALSQIYNEGDYKFLYMSSYEVPLGNSRLPRFEYNFQQLENKVDVKLNGVPFNGLPKYYSFGRFSQTAGFGGDETSSDLTLLHAGDRPVFIRTNSWGTTFDGKKENYLYTKITPDDGITEMILEADTLVTAPSNIKINIPTHDLGTLFISRNGFENESDLTEYNNHEIYNVSESGENTYDYVDLPILNGLEYYNTNVGYSYNGVSFSSRGTDDELNIEMPNWSANVEQINDTIYKLTASNPDVNYYNTSFLKTEESADFSIRYRMSWSYNLDVEGEKEFPLLSLPEVISEAMTESFFQNSDGSITTGVGVTHYTKYDSYTEVVAAFAFNQNALTTANNPFRYMFFSNQEASGKSNVTNPYLGLNGHHQFDRNMTSSFERKGYPRKSF